MPQEPVTLKISADVEGLNKALTEAAKKLDAWSKNAMGGFAEMAESLGKLTLRFSAMAAPVAAVGAALAGMVMKTADLGEELYKASRKTGISVEALSGLKQAAYMSEIEMDGLVQMIGHLSKNMVEARSGTGEADATFKALGISVKDARGNLRSTDNVLMDLADAFMNMKDGAGKTALAMQLFGRTGKDMLLLLSDGADGFRKFAEEAKKAGVFMTTEGAKAAAEFNDNVKEIKTNLNGLVQTIGNALIPALNELFDILSGKKTKWEQLDQIEKQINRIKKTLEMSSSWLFGLGTAERERLEKELEALIKERDALRRELTHSAPGAAKKEAPVINAEADKVFQDFMNKMDEAERQLSVDILTGRLAKGMGGKSISATAFDEWTKNYEAFDEAMLKADQDLAKFYADLSKPPSPAEHERVRELFRKEAEEWLKVYGDFFEGFTKGLFDWDASVKRRFESGVEVARAAAQGMEQAFSDFFFDAMTGKLKSLWDYVKGFLESVARAISNVLAQQAAQSVINGISKIWSSSSTPTVVTTHSGGLIAHHGGLVPRFHFGGLSGDEVPIIAQKGERIFSIEHTKVVDGLSKLGQKLSGGRFGGNTVNVAVNVENRTGSPVDAQAGSVKFDGEKYIVNVIMKNINGYGALRHAIAGVK